MKWPTIDIVWCVLTNGDSRQSCRIFATAWITLDVGMAFKTDAKTDIAAHQSRDTLNPLTRFDRLPEEQGPVQVPTSMTVSNGVPGK